MVLLANKHHAVDSIIRVVTPENIAFEYRIAGPFRRLPALLLDYSFKALIVLVMAIAFGLAFGWISGGMAMALILVGSFIVDWFYGGIFETFMNGQTPGKWILGLRVLTDDGQPINGMQAVLRNILRSADLFLGGVGIAVMMSNDKYQRLGDLVCGTIVVVEQRQWLLGVAKLDDPRAIQLASYLPPNFVVPRSMAKAISTYVERRKYFTVPRRREVARHLAEPLLERFGLPPDTSYDLLLCALYYRTFIADRKEDERRLAEANAAALAQQRAFVGGYPQAAYGGTPFGGGPPPLPQQQMIGVPSGRSG
jgi:uncharacterized RDD family membrane protein YckC